MRIFRIGVMSSLAIFAFVSALSTQVIGQDERLIGGGSGITVFLDRNFRGDVVTYQNNVRSLPSRFNNSISSLRVGYGEQWQVCDQPNFRGQCVTVSGEESNLGRNRWDNRISSMRRISGGNQGGGPGWGNQPGGPGWGNPQGGAVRPPNWAEGTFYGVAPNGSQISLTIAPNGSVTANVNGGMSYGIFTRGNFLNIGGATSRVTRQGNGILTTSTSDGERIAYQRTSGGNNPGWGGNNPGPGWGGGNNNPPNWAIGRFRASNPQGGTITMIITNDGNVTVNMGGGATAYGTLRGTMLTIDGNTAQLQQDRNGFRTVSTSDGQTIVYRRN